MSGAVGPVWLYWEQTLPPYLELCLETVRRHHPDAVLLDRASFDALHHADRDLPIDVLGPHHRADFIRAYLLRHQGGLWLDVDFVCLRPLDELFDLPDPVGFCGYRVDQGGVSNAFIWARPGSTVAAEFYDRVCSHLREGHRIDWLEIGSLALTPVVDEHPDEVHLLDPDLVSPIPWHQSARFEQPGDAESLADSGRYGVMLSNNSMSADWRARPRDDVLTSDTLLGDLLRRALN